MSTEKVKTVEAKVVGRDEEEYNGKIDVIPGITVKDLKEKIAEKLGSGISVPPYRLSLMKNGDELVGEVFDQVSHGDEIEVSPKPDIATYHQTLSPPFIRSGGGFP